MKRAPFFAAVIVMLFFATPGSAQIPARGLSALVCLAGVNGNGTYAVGPSGALVIEVSGDNGSSATVHIIHGGDDSTHVVTYTDTDASGTLNCGDVIRSVS